MLHFSMEKFQTFLALAAASDAATTRDRLINLYFDLDARTGTWTEDRMNGEGRERERGDAVALSLSHTHNLGGTPSTESIQHRVVPPATVVCVLVHLAGGRGPRRNPIHTWASLFFCTRVTGLDFLCKPRI